MEQDPDYCVGKEALLLVLSEDGGSACALLLLGFTPNPIEEKD